MSLSLQIDEKKFGKQVIFQNVRFDFPDSGLIVITGENGSGKTTLLNILSLMDVRFRGSYFVSGKDLKKLSPSEKCRIRREEISYILQKNNLVSYLTVDENCCLGAKKIRGSEKKSIQSLSQGQQEMVAVERELVPGKRLYLLDEVTANLDPDNAGLVAEKLRKLSEKALVIVVSHDPDLASSADILYRMEKGKVILLRKATLPSQEEKTAVQKQSDRTHDFGVLFGKRTMKQSVSYLLSFFLLMLTSVFGWVGIDVLDKDPYPYLEKATENTSYIAVDENRNISFQDFRNRFPEESYLDYNEYIVYSDSVPRDGTIHLSSLTMQNNSHDFSNGKYVVDDTPITIDDSVPYELAFFNDEEERIPSSEEDALCFEIINNYWPIRGMSGFYYSRTQSDVSSHIYLINRNFVLNCDPSFSMPIEDGFFYVNDPDFIASGTVHFDYYPDFFTDDLGYVDLNEVYPSGVKMSSFSCAGITSSALSYILVSDSMMDRYRSFYRSPRRIVLSLKTQNRSALLHYVSDCCLTLDYIDFDHSLDEKEYHTSYNYLAEGKRYLPSLSSYGAMECFSVIFFCLFVFLISAHLLSEQERDDRLLRLKGYSPFFRYFLDFLPWIIVFLLSLGMGFLLAFFTVSFSGWTLQFTFLTLLKWILVYLGLAFLSHLLSYAWKRRV